MAGGQNGQINASRAAHAGRTRGSNRIARHAEQLRRYFKKARKTGLARSDTAFQRSHSRNFRRRRRRRRRGNRKARRLSRLRYAAYRNGRESVLPQPRLQTARGGGARSFRGEKRHGYRRLFRFHSHATVRKRIRENVFRFVSPDGGAAGNVGRF